MTSEATQPTKTAGQPAVTITLRPYQKEMLREVWREAQRVSILPPAEPPSRVACVQPTGAGKTVEILTLVNQLAKDMRWRSLVVVPTRKLVKQTVASVQKFYPDLEVGTVAEGKWNVKESHPIVIATAAGISGKKLQKFKRDEFQLIIIDEAHHALADSYSRLLRFFSGAKLQIGLTATFRRGDGESILSEDYFSTLLVWHTVAQLTEAGFLAPARGSFVYTATSLANVKKNINGDYDERALAKAVDTPERNALTVQAYREKAMDIPGGRSAVCFSVSINHARHLAEEFNARGIPAAAVWGAQDEKEQQRIFNDYRDGRIKVITNAMLLIEGWDCLDEETEILTADGWKGMGEVHKGDLMFALNRQSEKLELVPVQAVGVRELQKDEKMVRLKSQHLNIRVTEGHEFHLKYKNSQTGQLSTSWVTAKARELVNRRSPIGIPLASQFTYRGLDLSDDELRLIAWYLTDGYLHRTNLEIYQAKHFKDEIRELLRRLEFDFNETTKPNPGYKKDAAITVFRVPKGAMTGSRARRGWSKYEPYLDKKVSPLLHQMTREQFQVFWEELLKGDGERGEGKSGWLWCEHKEQADAYMQMAITRGLAVTYSTRVTQNSKTVYRVGVRDRQWLVTNPADRRAGKIEFDNAKPNEKVWCVQNEHSTLVTRRAGKTAIIGNCPITSCVLIARPATKASSFVLGPQMIGRGLRLYPGKKDAVIIELRDNAEESESLLAATMELDEKDILEAKPLHLQKQAKEKKKAEEEIAYLAGQIGDARFAAELFDVIEKLERASRMAWVPLGSRLYMSLSGKDFLEIVEEQAGRFALNLVEKGRLTTLKIAPTRERAMQLGESWIVANGRDHTFVRRDAEWRKKPATGAAVSRAAKLTGRPKNEIQKMTSGQVSDLINAALALKPGTEINHGQVNYAN